MHFIQFASILSLAAALPSRLQSRDEPTCSASTSTLANGRICTTSCASDRPGGDLSSVYTGSLSACVEACSQNNLCATAQFREENGYCYIKNSVNELTPVNGTDTVDCCPGPVTLAASNRICKTTCGQDRPGGDYGNQYTGSIDGCIQACGSDPKCVTAQYSLTNGYCYFKDSSHEFSANRAVDSVDCCPGPKTFSGRTCTTSCGQDRPGGDYGSQYTGSIDACIEACGQDSNCVTAQYHIENGYCYFKDSSNTLVAALGTDTVDCS